MTIGEWWPATNERVRMWVEDNVLTALSPFSLEEVAKAGGPTEGDAYWTRDRDGTGRYIPPEAVRWIGAQRSRPLQERGPDPRAAYFQRTWPKRQP